VNEKNIMKMLRKEILRISSIGHDGNLQSCFSSLEILWSLYNGGMNFDAKNRKSSNHDRFVLSKGQSNLAFMTVLAYSGYIEKEELDAFCGLNSRISMQADRTKFDGLIECSAGSLGHGFPIAVGMAMAAKIRGTSEHIYVLVGDGEMNEGTIWEAMILACSENLDNITMIIDDNDSISKMIKNGLNLPKKIESFGFVVDNVNGHDIKEVKSALCQRNSKPTTIIAKTVRGYGCKTIMEDNSWFHRSPTEFELPQLYKEVDEF